MFQYIINNYQALTKEQLNNRKLWFNFYTEVYHIGQERAIRLAGKKTNNKFNKNKG